MIAVARIMVAATMTSLEVEGTSTIDMPGKEKL